MATGQFSTGHGDDDDDARVRAATLYELRCRSATAGHKSVLTTYCLQLIAMNRRRFEQRCSVLAHPLGGTDTHAHRRLRRQEICSSPQRTKEPMKIFLSVYHELVNNQCCDPIHYTTLTTPPQLVLSISHKVVTTVQPRRFVPTNRHRSSNFSFRHRLLSASLFKIAHLLSRTTVLDSVMHDCK